METRLVVGCKTCYEEVKNTKGYTINKDGLLKTPFIVHTAYTNYELYDLFFENYTCPYCSELFKIKQEVILFVNDFIDNGYHIIFHNDHIEIMTDCKNYRIKEIMDWKQFADSGLLTKDEVQVLLQAQSNIDLNKWFFYIESGQVKKRYFKKYQGK